MEEPKSDTIQSVLDAQDIMLEDENMRFDFKKIKKNIGRDYGYLNLKMNLRNLRK